ncbi:MAG TPA: methyltransferase [Candidatus Alistipes merdigallinarum]|nr:methyltransferase [Candidatus Alistipes merdigallinarum]
MTTDSFVFKQFEIRQGRSAMKVGTDGVLLGAWFDVGIGAFRVLDVGAGTGLIALMAAQRNPWARIDAVEIDPESCTDAAENFRNSVWSDRIELYACSFSEFCSRAEAESYERIVSNPPYFVDSLRAADERRNWARHADALPYNELLRGVAKLLCKTGRFAVVLPVETYREFVMEAANNGLFPARRTDVITRVGKGPLRVLAEFVAEPERLCVETLTLIEDGSSDYSVAYKELVGDFYLKI